MKSNEFGLEASLDNLGEVENIISTRFLENIIFCIIYLQVLLGSFILWQNDNNVAFWKSSFSKPMIKVITQIIFNKKSWFRWGCFEHIKIDDSYEIYFVSDLTRSLKYEIFENVLESFLLFGNVMSS